MLTNENGAECNIKKNSSSLQKMVKCVIPSCVCIYSPIKHGNKHQIRSSILNILSPMKMLKHAIFDFEYALPHFQL
jgi:hypothetical protein